MYSIKKPLTSSLLNQFPIENYGRSIFYFHFIQKHCLVISFVFFSNCLFSFYFFFPSQLGTIKCLFRVQVPGLLSSAVHSDSNFTRSTPLELEVLKSSHSLVIFSTRQPALKWSLGGTVELFDGFSRPPSL